MRRIAIYTLLAVVACGTLEHEKSTKTTATLGLVQCEEEKQADDSEGDSPMEDWMLRGLLAAAAAWAIVWFFSSRAKARRSRT